MLSPYIERGMTILEVGPAMGFFTIPMAGLVGGEGRVVAADAQAGMLAGLKKRADKTHHANIVFHQCSVDSLHLEKYSGQVNFALIFWMLHEVPDAERLIGEVREAMSVGKLLLFAEPILHVRRAAYRRNVQIIEKAGFDLIDHPKIGISYASLFRKQ
jgi:ubiquinone/menaquinone biosynthesis C-methylase UbiE